MRISARVALFLGLLAAGGARGIGLSEDLAECLDGFGSLSAVARRVHSSPPRSRYLQHALRTQTLREVDQLMASVDRALTRARSREALLREQVEMIAFNVRDVAETLEARKADLDRESRERGGPLEPSHPVFAAYTAVRDGFSTLLHERDRTLSLLRVTESAVVRISNQTNRLRFLRRKLYDEPATGSRRAQLLSLVVAAARRAHQSLSPLEIQLIHLERGTSVEFDEIRRMRKRWVVVEAKTASGFGQEGKPPAENPETGQPFATHEEAWVYKHIYKKTLPKITALEEAFFHPEQFRTQGREGVTGLVPAPKELGAIRILRFELEGDAPGLRQQLRAMVRRLEREFPDWTFEWEMGSSGLDPAGSRP